jgi:hypothetical protein
MSKKANQSSKVSAKNAMLIELGEVSGARLLLGCCYQGCCGSGIENYEVISYGNSKAKGASSAAQPRL